ncbi:MAG TPA: hypothetical protein VER14_09680 [Phototrophicaceae bacterium]|nr:hypothetical protein [Phototrophicaceae bacterium]
MKKDALGLPYEKSTRSNPKTGKLKMRANNFICTKKRYPRFRLFI